MNNQVVKLLLLVAMLALTGCGGSSPSSASGSSPAAAAKAPGPPACSVGQGTNGDTSTLRLTLNGDAVTGTYDVTPAGSDVAVRYTITGTAKDGKLSTDWVVGALVLHVTGSYTATKVVLDNPSGKFSTTEFNAGCPG